MNTTVVNSKTEAVESLYADAAKAPAGLCCPQSYRPEFTRHIPKQAFDHNYGCGSPLLKAGVKEGETVVDLGSGVGIDCFVAARLVGSSGKVIGIDMTDAMLEQANNFNKKVAKTLGFNVVEFRKGVIEQIPVADNSVDLVVSNCVLNLSSNKEEVLREIHRILRPGGRMVISDIVVDREVEAEDQDNENLWAECYTGAIPVNQLVETYEKLGFLALTQLDESAWRELEGYNFGSITLRAYKLPSSRLAGCNYGGHLAVYLGPYFSVKDEEDHEFPRFAPTEVCDATAEKLRLGPYADSFLVLDIPALAKSESSSCGTGGCGTGSSCGTGADASASCGPGGCGTGSSCGTGSAATATDAGAGRLASPCCDPTDTATPCCDNNQPKADGSPCCDTLSAVQPAGCGCAMPEAAPAKSQVAPAPAPEPVKAAASACCDSGSSCGTGSSCGPSVSASASTSTSASAAMASDSSTAVAEECCACETESKSSGTACCGAGCGTCGCS
jgi:arsenite methyltransferase